MTDAVEISSDGNRLAVRLPLVIRKRGGRKAVVAAAAGPQSTLRGRGATARW